MTHDDTQPQAQAAFAFVMRRRSDVIMGAEEITSSRETVHGLLRFGVQGLVIQWRVARATERVGMEIRTDREIEPVREVTVPARAVAGAAVRWIWHRWPPGRYLVVTAADLRAFEELAGLAGLQLDHPAELALHLRRRDVLPARDFAGEIQLAAADRALREAAGQRDLPRPPGDTG
jgi:hypothetical protein